MVEEYTAEVLLGTFEDSPSALTQSSLAFLPRLRKLLKSSSLATSPTSVPFPNSRPLPSGTWRTRRRLVDNYTLTACPSPQIPLTLLPPVSSQPSLTRWFRSRRSRSSSPAKVPSILGWEDSCIGKTGCFCLVLFGFGAMINWILGSSSRSFPSIPTPAEKSLHDVPSSRVLDGRIEQDNSTDVIPIAFLNNFFCEFYLLIRSAWVSSLFPFSCGRALTHAPCAFDFLNGLKKTPR